MAYIKTEEEYGRQVKVLVANESEDGSGTWHTVTVDTNGYVQFVVAA
jgi:hypothetical protein|tara:strand:- start:852 stop:992 length:141 start_codon:yes stop_codon:yes gene_type:complete